MAQCDTGDNYEDVLARYLLVPKEDANRWDWETAYDRMQYFNERERQNKR